MGIYHCSFSKFGVYNHVICGPDTISSWSCCCGSSCSQSSKEDQVQSQREGKFFWQSKVQGYGDGCHHHPEGEVRVFPECHQEPPEQQVQGGCGQEGWYPEQDA